MRHEIIVRRREESIRNLKGWTLVYGRRKTGKTFLLRRIFEGAHYFVITRSGLAMKENGCAISYIEVAEAIKRICALLDDGETVILDEFQRLPDRFWDAIALHHPNGKLIASGSLRDLGWGFR